MSVNRLPQDSTPISLTYIKYIILRVIGNEMPSLLGILTIVKPIDNQLLQLCTARIAWSDSVIRSETSLITESDRSGPIRKVSLFRSFSVNVLPW